MVLKANCESPTNYKSDSVQFRTQDFKHLFNLVQFGWADIGRRNGIENQSRSSGRLTKFLNGIETTRIEIFLT